MIDDGNNEPQVGGRKRRGAGRAEGAGDCALTGNRHYFIETRPDTQRQHLSDVSSNNISTLPRDALLPAFALRDLNLSLNRLESVSAGALSGGGTGGALARLWLDACALRRLPAHALRDLPRLHFLSADDNMLTEVEDNALEALRALRTLRLARNQLRAPPAAALAPLARLQYLDLSGNLIGELGEEALPPLPSLHTLLLRHNRISHVEPRAFTGVPALRVLRLEDNLLTELPAALQLLPQLEDLWAGGNRVEWAGPETLAGCGRLAWLDLRRNPLSSLHPRSLDRLPNLETLLMSEARGLTAIPVLNGSLRLRTLRADRARLTHLPASLCAHAPQLRTLDLKLNRLRRVPDLRACAELRVLDLSSNEIATLSAEEEGDDGAEEESALLGLGHLQDLLLAHNRLRRLPRHAFRHNPDLQILNVEGNEIEHIDMEAFVPIFKLQDL
ncbi:leucine-rich repeat-containing G-protein coupled receptor 4-like [Hyposmocoma kahamanoa]|uniref:leucine-rich repeat-containing G-protein coupled receptor 4-like n=1 Tax=Hyposmocoma kahamanoa TaxID=1477025 RepID=UPI000E6D6833|nr:leucine-rich repeat-containing G-protein coupled receptor 4-like [Hyposmocoma kahamanoa]